MKKIRTDILIIGMGGAAQLAALNAFDANPDLKIVIVTKALQGKGGCSRMVQGGFNVVLNPADSHEKHLRDTLKGGQYINNQELAKTLVEQATPTIKEMETLYGCFFDRNPDGTVHQKAFAGQSFDRTVHKGDLTGIEIISRTTEQIMKRGIPVLEECRALDLLLDTTGRRGRRRAAPGYAKQGNFWSPWKRRQRWWPRAADPPVIGFSLRARKSRWTAWACFTGPGCGWWTWRCSSSIRRG